MKFIMIYLFLEEILRLRGKDRTAEQLGWSHGGSGLQTSPRVDEPFFFHTLQYF